MKSLAAGKFKDVCLKLLDEVARTKSKPGLEERFLDAAVWIDIGDDIRVPVIRAEDFIVTKVLAGRPKDREDIHGVLVERLDRLDLVSIRETLAMLEAALGVSDLIRAFEADLARASSPS
jgi:predicted nucleotidyltransferase